MKIISTLVAVGCVLALTSCSFLPTAAVIEYSRTTSAGFEFKAKPDGAIYKWDFGDGAGSDQQNPSYAYQERGTYTVNLKIILDDERAIFAHITVEAGYDWTVGKYEDLAAAIEEATPGDTIYLTDEPDDGREALPHVPVTVTKNLQIIGRGGELTCVHYRGIDGSLEDVQLSGDGVSPALALEDSSLLIKGCTFDGASTDVYGGGACVIDSRANFQDCIFQNCYSMLGGGAVYAAGQSTFPVFDGCRFATNSTKGVGGAIFLMPLVDEALTEDAELAEITNCHFQSNSSGGVLSGGGIHVRVGCRAIMQGNTFSGNRPEDFVLEDQS